MGRPASKNEHAESKKRAAGKAVEFIEEGMVVGLGTGSTAFWVIRKIGERVKEGLNIRAVATSLKTENLAREQGIPLAPFADIDTIDLAIDGADEVDAQQNLIKGGGGSLLREKIVAYNSKRFLVVVDEAKLVQQLGKFPLPVEILPFAAELTIRHLQQLGARVHLRQAANQTYVTDNGNYIADCDFYPITEPALLNTKLRTIPGVLETGLFLHTMVSSVIVGHATGLVTII